MQVQRQTQISLWLLLTIKGLRACLSTKVNKAASSVSTSSHSYSSREHMNNLTGTSITQQVKHQNTDWTIGVQSPGGA
jgi:hypothetical protein